ncbi:hypothetical protein KP509_21G028100 [Ceratopteris richardii]|uniref:Right handed beta helix domain-containing protein n=1 Tax=Ceratopteris richardii TaxID=49495 RepID=A0A8T2S9U4_CERRI|nr:hypothetical protein KP509_21G028100 [Ceratopteris richardii]
MWLLFPQIAVCSNYTFRMRASTYVASCWSHWLLISTIAYCFPIQHRNPSVWSSRNLQSGRLNSQFLTALHAVGYTRNYMRSGSRWWQGRLLQNEKNFNSSSPIFYPTANGADPTGGSDSTAALQKTINDAFEIASSFSLLKGIRDLGGVQIHLGGGQYILSKPLTIPELGGGNIMIYGGTLRAANTFPTDRFLVELGSQEISQPNYEDIVLQNLMLDCNYRGGGILLLNPIRITISDCYITHFSSVGISVHKGHETFIHNSFLGQHITVGGDPQESNFSGTAIRLDSNDNDVTDVVIFSAQIGIEVLGQANIMKGVHCYNKATGWGGTGIMIKKGATQNRIIGCYMDYTGIVLEESNRITISNSYFLGDAFILLKAGTSGTAFGLSIVDNIFTGSDHGVPIVQAQGTFSLVKQTRVDDNSAAGMALRSTRARVSVSGSGNSWTADLSHVLLFPGAVAHVQYSFYTPQLNATNATATFPQHALQSITATSITVVSDQPVDAVVSFSVDQSSYGDNEMQNIYHVTSPGLQMAPLKH